MSEHPATPWRDGNPDHAYMRTSERVERPEPEHIHKVGSISHGLVGVLLDAPPTLATLSCVSTVDAEEARRLARWLIQFADWAESEERG